MPGDDGACILVVDDHDAVRSALRGCIETFFPHVRIVTIASGEESVALATRLDPDVVVMDVQLPGIDGFEATRQIKHKNPGTHVIIHTFRKQSDLQQRAQEAGARACLCKGDSHDRLIALLREYLEEGQSG